MSYLTEAWKELNQKGEWSSKKVKKTNKKLNESVNLNEEKELNIAGDMDVYSAKNDNEPMNMNTSREEQLSKKIEQKIAESRYPHDCERIIRGLCKYYSDGEFRNGKFFYDDLVNSVLDKYREILLADNQQLKPAVVDAPELINRLKDQYRKLIDKYNEANAGSNRELKRQTGAKLARFERGLDKHLEAGEISEDMYYQLKSAITQL